MPKGDVDLDSVPDTMKVPEGTLSTALETSGSLKIYNNTRTAPVLDTYTDTLSTGMDICTKNYSVLKDRDCSNTNTDNRLQGRMRKTPTMKRSATLDHHDKINFSKILVKACLSVKT